jgi:N-acyl homoserine lactone hydrolase
MRRTALRFFFSVAIPVFFITAVTNGRPQTASSAPHKAKPPRSLRLYVFDCGVLHNSDMARFSLKKEEVTTTDMSIACFLIAHPKGTLIWDVGAIPDQEWTPTGKPVTVHVSLPDGQQREADVTKPLLGQLSEIGYAPSDINYIALSHYHYDHTANANAFAGSTWLVPQLERETMFGG